jgi:hypothetical protein
MTELADEVWNEPLTACPCHRRRCTSWIPCCPCVDAAAAATTVHQTPSPKPPNLASKADFRTGWALSPTLPSLIEDHGLSEYFVVVHPFGELPARRAVPPGANVTLSVLYEPTDID